MEALQPASAYFAAAETANYTFMRIAIISDLTGWSWAGCEELWAALAKSALEAGHQVALFLAREDVPAGKLQPLEKLGIELHLPGPGERIVSRVRRQVSWKAASIVAPLFPPFTGVRKFAPDVVFISAGDALPNTLFLSQIERSGALEFPYVLICHNSYLFGRPAENSERERAVRYYRGARRVLFVAERTRMETEHLLAAKLPQARIVRNPVNMADLSPVPMPATSTVHIASTGRLAINSKGQDILLAALGSPELQSRDWKLSIYGTGPDVEHLKLLAQHYGIAEKVSFKGYTNEVRAIWAEHHLLALPSRVESAPLVLVEAMLCGRPSVVNDVGGVGEWASEPETGFVSCGSQIESFRACLERAWSARSEWTSIGQRAREKALRMLDPDPGGTALKILEEVRAEPVRVAAN